MEIDNMIKEKKRVGRCLFLTCFGFFLITTSPVFSYQPVGNVSIDDGCTTKVIVLHVISHEGINYVNWTIKGQNLYDLFLVQRSVDGGEFETVEFEMGLPVDPALVIGKSYIDYRLPPGKLRYRIRIIDKNQEAIHSETVIPVTRRPASNPKGRILDFL